MDELLADQSTASTDLSIDGPHGSVCFDGPTADDLLLIAGGSGVGQCRSIIDLLRCRGQRHPVRLVWSVAQAAQLYCDAELRAFATWLGYTAVVDRPKSENAAVTWLRDATLPQSGRVVVSGGPGFVYSVADALKALGTGSASIESDVFSYAPR